MLTIHERQRTGQSGLVKVLRPDACLDYECLMDLVGSLESLGQAGGTVVLDLSDTHYIDSSGIAALLHIVRHLPASERLQVVHCSRSLGDVLRHCHLDRWVMIHH